MATVFLPNQTVGQDNISGILNTTNSAAYMYDPFYFDWVNIVEIVCLAVLALIAIPSNGLLVLVKYKQRSKTTTDYLVLTLAGLDLLCAGFVSPVVMIYSGLRRYVISPGFCKLVSFSSYFTFFSAAPLIGALAVDRFIVTILPFNRIYDTSVAKKICIGISGMSVLLTSPFFFLVSMDDLYYCVFVEGVVDFINWWNGILIFFFVIIYAAIIFCYTSIAVMLKKRVAKTNKENYETRHWKPCQPKVPVNHTDIHLAVYKPPQRQISSITTIAEKTRNSREIQQITCEKENHLTVPVMIISTPVVPIKTMENPGTNKAKLPELKPKRETTNHVTLVLFTISVIYMISWTCGSVVMATNFALPRAISQLAHIIRKISLVSNPLLYIFMSSKFKQSAKRMIFRK